MRFCGTESTLSKILQISAVSASHALRGADPYKVTDAGGAFYSGDSFVVYPAKDGTPYNSLRLNVFYDAFQDMLALKLLESKISRDKTLAVLEDGLDKPITFSDYPRGDKWILEMRERINHAIINAK